MNAIVESKLSFFLHGVYGRLTGLRQARRLYEPLLATSFSPIELLSPYENDLSRFFADLLSPNGNHGQGPIFLQLFLDRFELKDPWLDARYVRVETEAQTFNGRRIDIKLSFGERGAALPAGVIGIENKPWAMDQRSQVADYILDLERQVGTNHFLIYLTGSGEGPTAYSTGGNEFSTLKVVSYQDLNCWLRDCASQTQAIRVKFFIEEFVRYIDKQFSGVQDMGEREMIATEICQSAESLEAALSVFAAMPEIKNRLLDKLFSEFKALVQTRSPEWMVDIDLKTAQESRFKGISVKLALDDAYRFRLAFEQNSCNELLFGVCKSTESSPDRPELHESIKKIAGQGLQSKYWPWYKNYEPLNWGRDSAGWSLIQSGDMGEHIFKDIQNLYEGLKKENLLDQLQ